MMVGIASIAAMAFSLLASVATPAAFLWYCSRHFKINGKALGAGVAVFLVFSQVLEKLMHLYVLRWNVTTAHLMNNVWLFAVYGSLAAGLFEEGGRYLAFRYLLQKARRWEDGVSYGIGHGGAEAILIGVLGNVNNIVASLLINSGAMAKIVTQVPAADLAKFQAIQHTLIDARPELFLVSGCERAMAFLLQVALSLLVLYGVKQRNIGIIALAVLVHAAVDFPAALTQRGMISTWLVEAIVLVSAILAGIFIVRSKRLFVGSTTAAA